MKQVLIVSQSTKTLSVSALWIHHVLHLQTSKEIKITKCQNMLSPWHKTLLASVEMRRGKSRAVTDMARKKGLGLGWWRGCNNNNSNSGKGKMERRVTFPPPPPNGTAIKGSSFLEVRKRKHIDREAFSLLFLAAQNDTIFPFPPRKKTSSCVGGYFFTSLVN